MKRWICIILATVTLLSCIASCTPKDGTADSSSGAGSSDASKTESSKDTYVPYYEVPEGYQDVNADIINAGGSKGWDVSEYFDMEAEGYALYDGVYMVNAEVLRRLTEVPVVGDGRVVWTDFKILNKGVGNKDPFMGYIPVEKLHDPVYMSMNLPSELQTYMKERINPANMYPANEKYRKLLAIGAVYKNNEVELPDDAVITVCIKDIQLLVCTETEGWHVGNKKDYPDDPRIYPLPWTLEDTLRAIKLSGDYVTVKGDHVEIKLTGAMLNDTHGFPDELKSMVEGGVLHFWGANRYGDGSQVKGCVASYVAWIKEPEYVGKVVATIGADWRTSKDQISQAFSGYNYMLTTEPRLILGHNVGPNSYDTIMDTDKVQQLLGLK